MHTKSVFHVIVSNAIGLLIFVLIVFLANFFLLIINNSVYSQTVNFVNNNITFMVVMSVIFAIGELFFALPFPVNLPAPLFSSLGTIFLITFIGRVFQLIGGMTDVDIIEAFRILSFIIYPLAFFGTLIGGYISIFAALFVPCNKHKDKKKEKKIIHANKGTTWDDVGNEFKNTLLDFFSMLRRKFNDK